MRHTLGAVLIALGYRLGRLGVRLYGITPTTTAEVERYLAWRRAHGGEERPA